MTKERQMIDGTVKKPFVNFNYTNQRVSIGKDQGFIDEEEYEIVVTNPGPYFDVEKMKEEFGESADILAAMVLSLKLKDMNGKDNFKFVLDGKECLLEKGKHYKYLI